MAASVQGQLRGDVDGHVEHGPLPRAQGGGNFGRGQHRLAHVDANAIVTGPAGANDPRKRFDADLIGTGVPGVAQVLEEGSNAVGAHLHLGAVGVEDLHAEICPHPGAHNQHLVEPDAEIAIAYSACESREIQG